MGYPNNIVRRQFSSLLIILFFGSHAVSAQKNISVGEEAPQITVTEWLLNVPADTNLNGKYIILDFWATWCKPCLALVPHLNRLQEISARPDVYFISMTDEAPEVAGKVFDKLSFQSIVVTDEYGLTHRNFGDGKRGIAYYPMAVLIDKDNIIRWFGNPGDLTEEMLKIFLEDKPIEWTKSAQAQNDFNQNLPEIIDMETFSDLFEKEDAIFMVHLKELYTQPATPPQRIFIEGTRGGFASYISLEELFRILFPYERFVFPPDYLGRIYNFSYLNKDVDRDSERRLKSELFSILKLKAETKTEAVTNYLVSVGDESLLVPDDLTEMTSFRDLDFQVLSFSKYSIGGLLGILTQKTDSEWSFKGKDKGKYSFEIIMASTETIIQSLKQYGLKVKPKQGEIVTTYLSVP